MAPPNRCNLNQEIIKPIDTLMRKNENKITSKVDLKVACFGVNNWPINAKPMNEKTQCTSRFCS